MKKTLLKWTILIVLLAYTVCITMWAGEQHAMQKCTGVEIELSGSAGPLSLTQEGIRSVVLNHEPGLVGKDLKNVDIEALETYLYGLNYFESVQCYVTSQGKLKVAVTPMIPVARIFEGSKSYYINKDGKKIDAIPSLHCDVPVITGNFTKEFPPVKLMPVIEYIHNDQTLANLVTMIKVDDPDNIILSTIWRGHVVNIGDTANLPRKFNYLKTSYEQILPSQGWETYDTIYVKFKGQIVASRRDKTILQHSEEVADDFDPEEEALKTTDMSHTGTEMKPAPEATTPKASTDSIKKNN